MTRRFPLYAKILTWFFLNLVLLVVIAFIVFRGQFQFGLNLILSGSANERLEPVANLIVEELRDQPREEWDAILDRFSQAYSIQFYLFENNGAQLAGERIQLPPQVHHRLVDSRRDLPPGPRWQRPAFDGPPELSERPPLGPDGFPGRYRGDRDWDGPGGFDGRSSQRRSGPRPKFMMCTSDPTSYWMLVRLLIHDPPERRPTMATLIASSESLSGGGLFIDWKPWLAIGAGVVVLSVLFWLPLIRGITRSVGQMTHATRQIAEGRFDVRVNETRRDELGELGESVNRMAGRLEGYVAGQKRFLGDIAHELCSPLARLRMALGILEERGLQQAGNYVDVASDKAEEIAHLVNELLSFSRASLGSAKIKLESVALNDIAQKAIERERQDHVSIELELSKSLAAMAEPELLSRALANLIRNAVRYAGDAGPITVSGEEKNDFIELTVSDCGPGIPPDELPKVFDPFYRVDSSRDRETGGIGLGLSIVKTCVESCGGTVTCCNREPSGLEVSIRLTTAKV